MTEKEFRERLEKLPPVEDIWNKIPLDYPVLAIRTNNLVGWTCPRCGWQKNSIQHCLRCGQYLVYGEYLDNTCKHKDVDEECEALDKLAEEKGYPYGYNTLTGEKQMSLVEQRKEILLKYPYKPNEK